MFRWHFHKAPTSDLLTTSAYYFAAPDAPSKTSECEFGKHLFRKEQDVMDFVKAHYVLPNNTSDEEDDEEEENLDAEEASDHSEEEEEEEEDEGVTRMPFPEHLFRKEQDVKNSVKAQNLLPNNTSEEEEEEEIEGIVDCESESASDEEEDYHNMPFAELWKKLKQQG
jgi:hypothetical protein